MPGGNGNGTGTGSGNGPLQLNKTGSAGSGIDTSPAPQPAQMSRTASSAPVPTPEMETQSRSATVSAMQQSQTIQIDAQTQERFLQMTHSDFQMTSHTIVQLGQELSKRTYGEGKKFFKWKVRPSSQMKAVTKAIDAYSDMIKKPVVAERFKLDLHEMSNKYLGIIQACSSYITSHDNPSTEDGQIRLSHVKTIYVTASRELDLLGHNAEFYKSVQGAYTWNDVVASERTMSYEHGHDGVDISHAGGGASDVLVIRAGGKKVFFKEKEAVEAYDGVDIAQKMTEIYAKQLALGASTLEPEEKDKLTLKRQMMEDVTKAAKVLKARNPDAYQIFMHAAVNSFTTENVPREAFLNLDMELKGCTDIYDKYYGTKTEPAETRALFVETMKEYGKYFNMHDMAQHRGYIAPGQSLTSRNVLTYRLAEAFNIQDTIVETHTAKITVNGEQKEGIVMADSGGVPVGDLFEKPEYVGKKVHYTPKAMQQLVNLQLFDLICGQMDRSDANIHCIPRVIGDQIYIESIIGIDNDLSFGEISHDQLSGKEPVQLDLGKSKPALKHSEKEPKQRIPAIDANFAQRILTWDPAHLDFFTSDLLSEGEKMMLKDRLIGLQDDIRELMEREAKTGEKIFIRTTEEWQALIDTMEDMPETEQGEIRKASYIQARALGHSSADRVFAT